MAKVKSSSSTKRYGTRYGKTLKEKASRIEKNMRKRHNCPFCGKPAVRRVSAGIWHCRKCDSRFAGQAYVPESRFKTAVREREVPDITAEESIEVEPEDGQV